MNKNFVTYKIALKLKELGFDEECFGFFESKTSVVYPFLNMNAREAIAAPLWQQAMSFLLPKLGKPYYRVILIKKNGNYLLQVNDNDSLDDDWIAYSDGTNEDAVYNLLELIDK